MVSQEVIYNLYFAPGSRFEKWTVMHEIGSGGLGKVFMGFMGCGPGNGTFAALKVLPSQEISVPMFQAYLMQEYKILSELGDHGNIVKLLPQDRYSVLKGNSEIYYLTLEYCPGGNLEQFRRQYPDGVMPATDVFLCLEQIVRGLQYAHEKEIIHGDLCPQNILLGRPNLLKIADFGIGRLGSSPMPMRGQRLLYQAPETAHEQTISPKTDIWALGILTYRLLTGSFPFYGEEEQELYQRIHTQLLTWPRHLTDFPVDTIEASLIYFVRQMLTLSPKNRPSCKDMLAAIQRCRRLVQSEELAAFEERFSTQVQLKDKRPQTRLLKKMVPETLPVATKGQTDLDWEITNHKLQTARLRSGILAVLVAGLLLTLAWFAYRWLQSRPIRFSQPANTAMSLNLQVTPQAKSLYHLAVIARSPGGKRVTMRNLRGHDLQITLYCQHENGDQLKLTPAWESIFSGNFQWEVPQKWPDGQVIFWVEGSWQQGPVVKSPPVNIVITGVYQDRLLFARAGEIESQFSHDPSQYHKIVKAYDDYCQKFPQGCLKEQALKKLERYKPEAMDYRYRHVLDFARKSPEKIKEIIEHCSQFLKKYSAFPAADKIREIIKYCQQISTPRKYRVTLRQGNIDNTINKLLSADCFVKVYRNNALIWQSKVILNNNRPRWNADFFVTWKIGDAIKVELWDKNIGIWQDKLYFTTSDSSTFSLQLLNKRLGPPGNWIEFSCDLPLSPARKK